MGMAKRDHIRAILELEDVAQRWGTVVGTAGDTAIDAVYECFLPLQGELLERHSKLIPGAEEAIAYCESNGIRIGSTTGYTRELMDLLEPLAAEQGYRPVAVVTASDISPGRPQPWMCFEAMRLLGVYPPAAVVKVDDTTVGVQAGLRAGAWSVGVAGTGNLVGCDADEFEALSAEQQERAVRDARSILIDAGAHAVIDSIAELPALIEEVNAQLSCVASS